eukprot:951453-Alexandrium_andersonii.AAC.1
MHNTRAHNTTHNIFRSHFGACPSTPSRTCAPSCLVRSLAARRFAVQARAPPSSAWLREAGPLRPARAALLRLRP